MMPSHSKHSNIQNLVVTAENEQRLPAENTTVGLNKQGVSIPPVLSWQPTHHFDMDLVITTNGEWIHEGVKIERQKLVNLFASILYCEIAQNGNKTYFLQSPVEKARITVEDVPFMVTELYTFDEQGVNWIQLHTNTGDIINVDANNPIFMKAFINSAGETEFRPYITVRQSMDAFIHRNCFYHLISIGKLIDNKDETILYVSSGGHDMQLSQQA